MRLMIATPAYDPMVWMETYAAMVQLDKCGMDVVSFTPTGFTVSKARTLTAEAAIAEKADWLLFVDSDVVPPKDGLRNLLEHDKEVCFGYYTKGTGDGDQTCLYEKGDTYGKIIGREQLKELNRSGETLLEVHAGGMGFALVWVPVFGMIRKGWFEYAWSPSGRKMSEDYHFCNRCREAGLKLYADTRVDCGHMRPQVI